jgi:hypothetical protein
MGVIRTRFSMTVAVVLIGALTLVSGASPAGARPIGRSGSRGMKPSAPAGRVAAGIECTTPTSQEQNKLMDCPEDSAKPTNNLRIAVDPTDPNHVVAGGQDFVDVINLDGPSEFYTTLDGGKAWTSGDLPLAPGKTFSDDPTVAFDARDGTVVYSVATYYLRPDGAPCNLDTAASVSRDGGLNWSVPTPIGRGHGCLSAPRFTAYGGGGEMVADNNPASPHYGRVYVATLHAVCRAYCDFEQAGTSTTIQVSYSDDGGFTWTDPQDVSGSSPDFCTAYAVAPACADSWTPYPAVSPDGSVHVAFLNAQNQSAWEPGECCEDQILSVGSSDGGLTWSDPVHVTDMENGSRDLPSFVAEFGVFPSGGFTGTQLWADTYSWNLAASPIDGTLYVVFSDNRNGVHDSDTPVTNLDVLVMTSKDGGAAWAGPDVVSDAPSDQWEAFPAVNPATGELGVAFADRSDGSDQTVDLTLATGLPGAFTLQRVTTVSSSLQDNLWFPAGVEGCETCATFIGEFVGLAYGTDGKANLAWADLRRYVTVPGVGTGYTENSFYAKV